MTGISFKPGQFGFLQLDKKGFREPHPFTISSAPGEGKLSFTTKVLGDFTRRIRDEFEDKFSSLNKKIVVLESNNKQFATLETIKTAISHDVKIADYFLCGPRPMINSLQKELKAAGYPQGKCITRRLNSGRNERKHLSPVNQQNLPSNGLPMHLRAR